MKGVICASGSGSRLGSLTKVTSKHLLPVFDKPMIFYPLELLAKSGIDEVIVIVGGPFSGHYVNVLKNGKEFGLKKLNYAVQEEMGGIAQAIALAEDFADGDDIVVLLGDNCSDATISREIQDFTEGAHLFLKEVPDPERFGCVELNENGRITDIIEKPKNPPSNLIATGLYIYDYTVFDRIKTLSPSARGELEVTDLNKSYLNDWNLNWSLLNGWWRDVGSYDSLLEASNYWSSKARKEVPNMGCI